MSKVLAKLIVTNLILLLLVLSGYAYGQECEASLSMYNANYIDRDGTQLLSLPLYIGSDCYIGAIRLDIVTEPFGALEAVDIDTTGSIISYWEYLETTRMRFDHRMRFLGIANYPDEVDTPPLEPQDGLLFNVLFRYGCSYTESVLVEVTMDSVSISDSTGYIVFDQVNTATSTVYVGNDVTPIIRGDVTCDGNRRGSDVVYLVNYFRGAADDCPCSRCAGDANNDGRIISGDVTYLVNFFRGRTDPLDPCE